MDAATIKELANTVKTIGENKDVFLWLVISDYLFSVSIAALVVAGFSYCVRLFSRTMSSHFEETLMQIRAILDIGEAGHVTRDEASRIIEKVRELQKKLENRN